MNLIIDNKSNRNFGLVFSVFFIFLSYFFRDNYIICYLFVMLSLLLVCISFLKSEILLIPNKYWIKFGHLLGLVVSPIVMAIIYLAVVLPTNLILKVIGKDILNLKIDKKTNTYWIKKNTANTMDNQF